MKRFLRIWIGALLLVFLFTTGGRAGEVVSPPAGQYLPSEDTGLPARTVILGAAFAGVADDASALFLNPAGLGELNFSQISVTSDFGDLEAFRETGLLGWRLAPGLGMGLSGAYLGFGSLEGRDEFGNPTGGYGADQISGQVGLGAEILEGIAVGGSFQFSQESLDGTAYQDFRPDLGLLVGFGKQWKLGLDYGFAGGGSWPGTYVSALTAGLSWEGFLNPDARILAAIGGLFQSDQTDLLQGGLEFAYESSFFVRGGYAVNPQPDGQRVLSLGAGFVVAGLTLDYAYLPYGDNFGDTHRFSLAIPLDSGEVSPSTAQGSVPAATLMEESAHDLSAPAPSPALASDSSSSHPELQSGSYSSAGNEEKLQAPPAPSAAGSVEKVPPPMSPPAAVGSPTPSSSLVVEFSIPADFGAQADLMASQGHWAQAVELYLQALAQQPQNVHLWWALGEAYGKLGREDYAVRCYKKVLEFDPSQKTLKEWVDQYEQNHPAP